MMESLTKEVHDASLKLIDEVSMTACPLSVVKSTVGTRDT